MKSAQHVRRSARIAITSCLIGALVVAAGSSPAIASSPRDEVERIAHLVARVAPFQGRVELAGRDGAISFGSATTKMPTSSAAPVVVAGDSDAPLEVSMPSQAKTARGLTATDGTIVYASVAGDVDVAAQVLDSGKVRLQTVINYPSAPHESTYKLGNGYAPARASDGSLWAYRFDQKGSLSLYRVGVAWARDANGNAVDTHYEIRDNSIVQVVSPTAGTAYPIVADPTWEWYAAAYGVGLSKQETRTLASAGSVTGFCALLGGVGGIACGVAGAYWFLQAGLAANANGCVFYAVLPPGLAFRWLSNNCR